MPASDYSWGPTWTDRSDLHSRICRLEADNRALRTRVAELEAENDTLLTGLCHAAKADGRGGRVGLPLLWKWVLGIGAVA